MAALLRQDQACVLLIDVQEKLTPLVIEHESFVARCQWLLNLAQDLQLPCLVSEHYPAGLGPTLSNLRSFGPVCTKVHFSFWRDELCKATLQSFKKNQVVLIGIETHVCVLQTALDLHNNGYEVFIIVDAVSSRHQLDHKYALKRMQQAGIYLLTAEMMFFELLEQANTPKFKILSKNYLQKSLPRS
jgi:nicotinamidase-related amidase